MALENKILVFKPAAHHESEKKMNNLQACSSIKIVHATANDP
uniref:Uncharacterized protein n=1 Tax=Rhizophora mucronata TaxID=61149 RepID=A0A2P2KPD1_RHIMU